MVPSIFFFLGGKSFSYNYAPDETLWLVLCREIIHQSGISGRRYVSRYQRCLYEGYPVLIKKTRAKLKTLIFLAHI